MPDTNPQFEASVKFGEAMFKARKEAEKQGEKVVPFGMRRIEPAEFRAEQEKGGPAVRKATLERLKREKGGTKQAIKEYRRMMEGK